MYEDCHGFGHCAATQGADFTTWAICVPGSPKALLDNICMYTTLYAYFICVGRCVYKYTHAAYEGCLLQVGHARWLKSWALRPRACAREGFASGAQGMQRSLSHNLPLPYHVGVPATKPAAHAGSSPTVRGILMQDHASFNDCISHWDKTAFGKHVGQD